MSLLRPEVAIALEVGATFDPTGVRFGPAGWRVHCRRGSHPLVSGWRNHRADAFRWRCIGIVRHRAANSVLAALHKRTPRVAHRRTVFGHLNIPLEETEDLRHAPNRPIVTADRCEPPAPAKTRRQACSVVHARCGRNRSGCLVGCIDQSRAEVYGDGEVRWRKNSSHSKKLMRAAPEWLKPRAANLFAGV